MTADEFVDLVAEMRAAQRDYFRRRDPSALDRSRELEKRVDRAIQEFKAPPTLF